MPTYDYLCDACGHAFEHFQSMSSKVLRKCPECTERKLRRLIGSGAGVIFKGSGFYQTDYKRSGAPPKPESSTSTASGDKKSEPKSDSKSKPKSGSGSDAGSSGASDSGSPGNSGD